MKIASPDLEDQPTNAVAYAKASVVAFVLMVLGVVSYSLLFGPARDVVVRDSGHLTPVVKLVAGKDSQAFGTGFHIGDGYIVTAAHVAEEITKTGYMVKSDKSVTRPQDWSLISVNKTTDLAVFKSNFDGPAYQIDCSPVRVGEEISTIGYPSDWGLWQTFGYVSSEERYDEQTGGQSSQLDIKAYSGNSGGPVLNRATNKVRGVLSKTMLLGRSRVPVGYSTMATSQALCEMSFLH